MKLAGKVALITGATRASAAQQRRCWPRKALRSCLPDGTRSAAKQVAQSINDDGGQAMFIQSDVRVAEECRAAVQKTLDRFGRIDILFNNAGVLPPEDGAGVYRGRMGRDHRLELERRLLDVEVRPSLDDRAWQRLDHLTRARGWGFLGGGKAAAYCAAKGGPDHNGQGDGYRSRSPGDSRQLRVPG